MSCRNQTRQNIQLRKSGGVITLHFLSILISCNIPHKLVFSIQCKEKIISSEIPFTFQWNSIQSNFLYPPNQKVTVNVLLVCHSIEINLVSLRNVNLLQDLFDISGQCHCSVRNKIGNKQIAKERKKEIYTFIYLIIFFNIKIEHSSCFYRVIILSL